ncbi:MAG: hypothetical protein MMC33_004165 [Icmadophila ericetorum]|nr:hypothetical protein [Icmadophila ericetorum]
MRLQRIRDGTLGRPPGAPDPALTANGSKNSKKRKASGDEEDEDDGRKKARQGTLKGRPIQPTRSTRSSQSPEKQHLPPVVEEVAKEEGEDEAEQQPPPINGTSATKDAIVDENEWAAFKREVATPPSQLDSFSGGAPAALLAAATISAAPMTVAEIAAKSREEASLQAKERREAELEGEKEDAALRLEEEFDVMEDLEGRVRRLKEKREELRRRRRDEGGGGGVDGDMEDVNGERASDGDDEGSEEDGDEVDDWQGWGLR